MNEYTTIEDYINNFPNKTKDILKKIHKTIQRTAPTAKEKISYGIPTFTLNGNLVHFAAYENHIGFYPGPGGIEAFHKDLADYKTSKGTVQFPINQPIPYKLIEKITSYRVEQNTRTSE